MRERHTDGTDVWRTPSDLLWGRGAGAYGARNACGVRASWKGKTLKKSRALVVHTHPASSVALAPITTSGGAMARRVWQTDGGVSEREEASETYGPGQAISSGTAQRDATPP